MKTSVAIALVALSASAAWAGEPASDAAAGVPVEAPKAEAKATAPALPTAVPGNFCGQAQVQAWFLSTDVGLQFQREQNAAVERALAPPNIEAGKAVAPPEPAAPPAGEAKAQAAQALPGVAMPRDIDGKRLQSAWFLSTESSAQLHRSYMAALIETEGRAKLPPAFARPRRQPASDPSRIWNPRELEAHLEARARILNAPEGMGLGLK